MRKTKKIILGILTFLLVFVTFLGATVKAAPITFTITYKTYKASDYNYRLTPEFSSEINGDSYANFLVDYTNANNLAGAGLDEMIWDNSAKGKYGISWTRAKELYEKCNNPVSTTTFIPGDRIVVETFMNFSTNDMKASQANLNIFDFCDSKTNIVPHVNKEIFGANTVSTTYPNHYGIGGALTNGITVTDVSLGAVEFTLKSGLTGACVIQSHLDYNTLVTASNGTAYNGTDNPSYFNIVPLTFTVQGASSSTDLEGVKINSKDPVSQSTVVVGTDTYDTYKATDTSGTVPFEASVKDGGTITKVQYGSSPADALNNGTTAPTVGGKYQIDVNSVPTGSTAWVYVEVESQDGGSTQGYFLEIPHAQSAHALIDNVTFTPNIVGGKLDLYDSSGATATTFAPGVTSYTIKCASDITSITVAAQFDVATYFQSCNISSTKTAVTNSTTTPHTATVVVANGDTIQVEAVAQNGSVKKTYTFKIHHLSVDTSLTSLDLQPTKNGTAIGNPLSLTSPSNNTYTVTDVDFTADGFKITPNGSTVQKITVDGVVISTGSQSGVISFPSSSKSISVVVESESGKTVTYTIVVNRAAAKTDTTLQTIIVNYAGTDYTATLNSVTGEYELNTKLPYTVNGAAGTNFKVKVALTDATIQTLKINGTSINHNVYTSNIAFASGNVALDTTETVTILVTAQDTTKTTTYTLKVVRAGADADNDFNLSLKDNTGTEIGTWANGIYTINGNLPYARNGSAISKIDAVVTANSSMAVVKIDNTTTTTATKNFLGTATGSVSFAITVTSEAGVNKTYSITITRDGADNNRTATVTGSDSMGTNSTFTLSAKDYKNDTIFVYEANQATFTITPAAALTKVFINGVDYTNTAYTATLHNSIIQDTTKVTVYIQTEADRAASSNGEAYTISLVRGAAETICNASFILKGGNDGTTYVPTISGNTYSYVLPQLTAGNSFTLDITSASTKAKVYTTLNSNDLQQTPYVAGTQYAIGTMLYIVVYAQNNVNHTVYTIDTEFTDTRDPDAKISNITSPEAPILFNQTTYAYSYTVPFTTKTINFNVVLSSINATLAQGKSGQYNLGVGKNLFYFQGKAENTTLGDIYTITVERSQGRTDQFIDTLKINGIDTFQINSGYNNVAFTQYMSTFDFVVSRTTSNAVLNFTVSAGAVFQVSSQGVTTSTTSPFTVSVTPGGYTLVTIAVTSEVNHVESTGTSTTYNIKIYCADQNYDINDIEILESQNGQNLLHSTTNLPFTFVSGQKSQTFKIAYKTNTAYIDVLKKSIYSTITGGGSIQPTLVGNNSYTIKIKSEYAALNSKITDQEATYTIIIEKEAADKDNTLSSLSVMISNTEMIANFQPGTNTYSISNVPNSATSAFIDYTTTSPKATVSGDLGNVSLDLISNNSQTFHVKVTNELGALNDYTIIISTTVIILDDTNGITDILVSDKNGLNTYITFNPATPTYNITVSANLGPINILATKQATTSTLSIDGNASATGLVSKALTAGSNFSVPIQCTAQSGKLGTLYTINVTVPQLDSDTTLKSMEVDSILIPGFVSSQTSYTMNVGNNVTSISLTGTPTSATSKALVSCPSTLAVGDNFCSIIVTAENGATKNYTVNIIRDEINTLTSLTAKVNGVDLINYDTSDVYSITVPYNTPTIDLAAVADGGSKVTVTGTGTKTLTAGIVNKLVVTVTSASGAKKEYTVNVTRTAGNADNFIETFEAIPGTPLANYNKQKNSHTYIVDRTSTLFDPVFTVSTGATFTLPVNRTLKLGSNTMNIVVTSETGVTRNYEFVVYRADQDFDIQDIQLLEQMNGNDVNDLTTGNPLNYLATNTNYSLTVPYTTNQVYLKVTPDSTYAKVYLNNALFVNGLVTLNQGSNTLQIYAVSEYGDFNKTDLTARSLLYTITITREAPNSDSSLKSLEVLVDGVDKIINFTPTQTEYVIENIGDTVTSVNIQAVANQLAPKAVLSGHLNNQKLDALSVSGGSVTGYVFTYIITCTAEDGSKTDYVVKISRGPLDLDGDNSINYITFIDSNNKEYLGQSTFSETTLIYNITIPYGPQSYTILVDKLQVSPSIITGAGQFTITQAMYGTTKTHTVFATSQKGVQGKVYELNVTFVAPSSDSSLKDLTVDGSTIPGFDPAVLNYTLATYPNSTASIDIAALVNDPTATVSGDTGSVNLIEGPNSFVISVTAQDGSTTNYKINVKREYPTPYLTNLLADGERLLDTNDKATVFDKEVMTYHVIVTFMTLTATIKASVDNAMHMVSCTNSTTLVNTGFNRSFTTSPLVVGTNTFVITVTSAEGIEVSYELIIVRRGEASTNTNLSSVEILEISTFKDDYSNLTLSYSYTVPNKIRNLTVKVICEVNQSPTGDGAKSAVYNDKNLKVGLNKVIILVTAEDEQTTRAIIVEVTREPMNFVVDKNATEFECLEDTTNPNKYIIELGENNATSIQDFTKYITFAEEDNLTVEVLSEVKEDSKEVIVRISDGSEEKLVTFQLNSETKPAEKPATEWWIWVGLIVSILILISILISVNRDKYGSVTKKRKKA